MKDRFAMLKRHHTTIGKVSAIATAIYFVIDRCIDIAWQLKIRMQRVYQAPLDRLARCRYCLPQYLPAINLQAAHIAALATKQIFVETFEGDLLE